MADADKAALRRRLAFVGAIAFFLAVVLVFRAILLPFMVAGLMAFVMEPVVRRLSTRAIRGRTMPRWVAVLAVYLTFFLGVGLVGAYAGPKLGEEAQKLIADTPRFLERVKREWVPEINEFLRSIVRKFRPEEPARAKELSVTGTSPQPWRTELQDLGVQAWRSLRGGGQPSRVDPRAARRALAEAQSGADKGQVFAQRLPDGSFNVQVRGAVVEVREVSKGHYHFVLHERERPWRKEPEHDIDVEKAIETRLNAFVDSFGTRFADYLSVGREVVIGFVTGLGLVALTFVIAAFLSIDLAATHRFFRSLVPRGAHGDYDQLMRHLGEGLSGVIRGQLVICLVNGVLTAIGLYTLGVPYAGIWSLLAAAMSLIPIFGTILSSAPMIGVSLFTSEPVGLLGLQGPTLALGVLVWILVIHFIEANILEPKIIGKHAQLHPVLVLFALLAGQHMYGIAGLIFAVPVLSVVQTLFLFVKDKLYGEDVKVESA